MPDLEQVRSFLRTACDASVALDRLATTCVQAGPDGPERLLFEVPRRGNPPVRLAARRVAADKARRIAATTNARPGPASGFAKPALYAPHLGLLFHVFPADERLASLAPAVDAAAMRPILEAVVGDRADRAPLESVACHVVRYKPARKCLLRYDLTWTGAVPPRAPRSVWARVVRDAKFEQIKGVLSALHETRAGAGFELPEPIAVVPELSMEIFGHVPGVALVALVDREEFPALCRRTGEALARFHRVALQAPAAFGIESQLNRLWENATEFSWMMRAEARWIADVASALAERLQASRREPLSLIHRDLHGGNILADGARLSLVDFEDCAIGEPADDVGSNWAHLTWHINGTGERAERAALARRAFLNGYLENATLPAAVLATYAAMHCFLYAHQCLRHPQDPARDAHARGMLAAAERVLDRDLP